jgi:Ca-activated chloride channel family protein
MHFANTLYISIALYAVILIAVFYVWAARRRRTLVRRFADKNLVSGLTPSASMFRRPIKTFFIGAAAILCLLALARPQWGFDWQEVKVAGVDILVALDVSKSMLATDVKPNRLERSKFAVKDLLKKLNGDRIGLIAFAGTAFTQCPLTIDYNGFRLALDDMGVRTIPRGGTSITAAINEAMKDLSGADKKYKVLVIITDGEELEGDALAAAQDAAKNGMKIYCVGVGSADGEIIPATADSGERGYLTDARGNVIKTSLNEDLLKRIAIATGGSYVRATQSEFGLTLLHDRSISKLEKRDLESKMKRRYHEHFQLLLAVAALFLFIEPLISERSRRVR